MWWNRLTYPKTSPIWYIVWQGLILIPSYGTEVCLSIHTMVKSGEDKIKFGSVGLGVDQVVELEINVLNRVLISGY